MQHLSVVGRIIYPGYELKMRILPLDPAQPELGLGTRYRLIYITEGNGVFMLNGRLYPITSPMVCCLDEADRLSILSEQGLAGRCLYFHPAVINWDLDMKKIKDSNENSNSLVSLDRWSLRPFIEREQDYTGLIPLNATLSMRIDWLMDQMASLMEDQPDSNWPCRCRSYLIESLFLLSRLYDCPRIEDLPDSNMVEESIRPVIIYLIRNFNRKITIDELTREFYMNKTTLNERFKKATGLSVMSYLITLRMQVACSFLKNTELPISDILHRVGYLDDAHFLRAFKKYSGLSPTEYRRINCWMLKESG
jgi:AraC-like DNA-binding protein